MKQKDKPILFTVFAISFDPVSVARNLRDTVALFSGNKKDINTKQVLVLAGNDTVRGSISIK